MSAANLPVRRFIALALTAASLAALAPTAQAGFNVFSVGGTTAAASIQATIDSFRAAIGGANNGNAAGPIGSGRREINWDGGGAATATVTAGSTLSAFTNNRGATMGTLGTGFLQTPVGDAALTGINAQYSSIFAPFSVQRIFTPTGSNITDVTFSIPGTNGATPATVSAFGAVFSDVAAQGTTKIEVFDLSNALLMLFNVPPGNEGTAPGAAFSFVGAIANAGEDIARVRITTGTGALGPSDNNADPNDMVVMDDFIYSEPAAVPEPAGAVLALVGALTLAAARRRRQ